MPLRQLCTLESTQLEVCRGIVGMEQKHPDAVIRHNSGAQLSKMKSQLKIFNDFSSTFEVSSSVFAKK